MEPLDGAATREREPTLGLRTFREADHVLLDGLPDFDNGRLYDLLLQNIVAPPRILRIGQTNVSWWPQGRLHRNGCSPPEL